MLRLLLKIPRITLPIYLKHKIIGVYYTSNKKILRAKIKIIFARSIFLFLGNGFKHLGEKCICPCKPWS